jgi:DsbC/DsbD-like thiol-disulfide interchange protein
MSGNALCFALRNRFLRFAALLVLLSGANAAAAGAQRPRAHHARVELIAEQAAIVPGKRFWVGLQFQLDPGWHIYWKNPGDSGTPPKVQWDLSPGFSAGEFLWPVPMRLGEPPIVDYGYESEVLLMLPVAAPANLTLGSTVTLGAKITVVVCRDICMADSAVVRLVLPVAKNAAGQASPSHALFAQTRAQLPRPAPRNWKIRALDGKGQFTLEVTTGVRQGQAAFFPLKEEQIDNAATQALVPLPRGVRLTLKKSDQLLKPISVLKGVLVFGPGRVYEIAAPVWPGR